MLIIETEVVPRSYLTGPAEELPKRKCFARPSESWKSFNSFSVTSVSGFAGIHQEARRTKKISLN
jgi:hypothetical protein